MQPVSSLVCPSAPESRIVRRRRRLQAFAPPYRRPISVLTASSTALEDLADSFPALLFALATGYGTSRVRAATLDAIEDGAALKVASTALGLPMWMRRVPTQALLCHLPPLPNDVEFRTTMTSRMPSNPSECGLWLDRVCMALELVGRDFALWVAREPRMLPPLTSDEDLQWIMAWAWASCHPASPGHRILRTGWSPDIGWKKARDDIAVWKKRIDLVGALAGEPRDAWFEDATVQGLQIVHLQSAQDFIAESMAMDNCLDQYAAHLAYGRVRIFSVRRDGRSIADLELTQRADEVTMACVSQIRGPRNRRAPPAVWQAVHAWLGAQPFRAIAISPTPISATREALKALWKPYAHALIAAGLAQRIGAPVLGLKVRSPRSTPAVPVMATATPRTPRRPLTVEGLSAAGDRS